MPSTAWVQSDWCAKKCSNQQTHRLNVWLRHVIVDVTALVNSFLTRLCADVRKQPGQSHWLLKLKASQ